MSKVLNTAYGVLPKQGFNSRTAMAEAMRCLLCEDAPCSADCPAGTDPGKFIRSLRFHNVKGAVETIRENNPLAGSCALVCPYDKLCEQACSRTSIDKPIEIGKLQSYLVGQEEALKMRVLAPGKPNGKKVACVGAGPASLACASELARAGFQVTLLEAESKAGGVLTYGISPTRLPQKIVDFDIGLIADLGVKFEFGKKVKAADIEALRSSYDAVFVGVGLGASKIVDLPGSDLKGVLFALDYLSKARSGQLKHTEDEFVVVIGGGDVCMDCASSAHQLGAKNTRIVYRRTIAEAPANSEELEFVQKLGIPFITEFAPVEILGENGAVSGVKCKGRDGYSELVVKADKVIFAIGQEVEKDFSGLTAKGNVFTGGDFTNGGQTVVQAVAEGKVAAKAISDFLRGKE